VLYHHPSEGRSHQRTPVRQELADEILSSYPAWDIDAYLPQATKDWCESFLQLIGFSHDQPLTTDLERSRPCYSAYIQLRSAVQNYLNSGQQPRLATLVTPTQARLRLLEEHDLLHVREVILDEEFLGLDEDDNAEGGESRES
jgi:hypothetical protein